MDVVEEFLGYLVAQGLALKTIRAYRGHINRALAWCADRQIELDQIGPMELLELTDTVPESYSSRSHFRSMLKHYWEWRQRPNPPIKAIRVPRKDPGVCRALSEEDARLVVKTAKHWYPEGTATLLALYLALRASEIAAWHWSRYTGEWYRVLGKGDKEAELPVHPTLASQLRWLPPSAPRSGYLFPGSRGRRHVHPTTVLGWVKQVGEAAGVKEFVTHQLRHTALATANDSLGDLRAVAAFARHSRVEDTMRYTRTTARRLKDVSDSLDYD